VLILCEVLRWPAVETAQLLDTSVAAVNSALQRARATLAALPDTARPRKVAVGQAALLARYVSAFERYDMASLVTLLHEDAVQSMPPFAMWIQGAQDITAWMVEPGPSECRGSRLLPVEVNGSPGYGQYRRDPDGGHKPWALQVVEISGDRIAGLHMYLDAESLFPVFGLPAHLPV
jgi:RNA polymerase sigma-70 factor (ECF subfamily)